MSGWNKRAGVARLGWRASIAQHASGL